MIVPSRMSGAGSNGFIGRIQKFAREIHRPPWGLFGPHSARRGFSCKITILSTARRSG